MERRTKEKKEADGAGFVDLLFLNIKYILT